MEPNYSRMISLNGTNYFKWKGKMKDLLFVKKLHLPVFATQKPESKKDEEWAFEHEMVCGYIRQWVDDNVLNHICNETNARNLWDKLESLYASKTGNNKLFLLKQAMNLRYREDSSISDHLNEFQGCFDQLSSMGVKFEDEILGLWLLNTLPDSWENLRVSLTSSAPGGTVTMEYVKTSILNEEVRRRTQETSTSNSGLLVTENRGRSKERDQGEDERSKSMGKSKFNLDCHYCGKKGHIKKFCFKWKKDKIKQDDRDSDGRVATTISDGLI